MGSDPILFFRHFAMNNIILFNNLSLLWDVAHPVCLFKKNPLSKEKQSF